MKQPEDVYRPGATLSPELLERMLSTAAEGITVADARLPDRPLVYCNEGFERLTGYSRDESLGRNCRFLQGEETDPGAVAEIRDAVANNRECVVELLNFRKDGTPFWNRLSLAPVTDEGGTVTHFIGVQSDVTARREAEEGLRAANDRLAEINREMSRDLQLAARVQQRFLPHALPSMAGVKVAWAVESSDELAGDSVGVMQLSESELGVFVVDVSGHGVASSLLSVAVMHWFEQRFGPVARAANVSFRTSYSPRAIAEDLNRSFPIDLDTGQYFTIVYGVLDTSSREFRYVCAGHPGPIHVPRDSTAGAIPTSSFPIGVVPDPGYEEHLVKLDVGDRIFLYSDGLTEAKSRAEIDFGIERVLDLVSGGPETDLDDVVDGLITSVSGWTGRGRQTDDVSVVGLEMV